jgi:hypothetical protein
LRRKKEDRARKESTKEIGERCDGMTIYKEETTGMNLSTKKDFFQGYPS